MLVLEKAPRDMRGGNTHWAGAVLRIAFDDPHELAPLLPGIEKEYEDFYEGITPYTRKDYMDDLLRVTSGRTDPVLSRILVDNSKDTVFWMHEIGGVKMEPAITVAGVKKGNMVVWPRGLVVRAVHEGVGLSRTWFATAGKRGIEIRYSSAATELILDGRGRIGGVKVRGPDGLETIHAKAVVLGCGGFEANVQMRTQHIGPLVGAAKVRGTPHNQGDGLRMAMAIGAMPWGQWSGCHATPISADWGDFAPREYTDRSNRLSYHYGLMINRRGRRFVDEGEDQNLYTYAKFGRAILAEPGAKGYQLFDSKVLHLLEPRYSTSKPIVAESVKELLAQLDIDDKEQALKTVEEFNAAQRTNKTFDPTKKDGHSTTGPRHRQDQLGREARYAALLRLLGDGRHHLHLRRPQDQRKCTGDRHGLAAAARSLHVRRDGRRAILRQLSGRHRPRVGRHLRAHRRPQCRQTGARLIRAQEIDGGSP